MTRAQVLEAAQALELAAAKLRALAGSPAPSTSAPAPQRQPGDVARVPFGRLKGDPLSTVTDQDLRWLQGALSRSLTDPEKARYRARNERDLANVTAEIEARASGTPTAPAQSPDETGGVEDDIPF